MLSIWKILQKRLLILAILPTVFSCTVTKYVPIETQVNVRDSVAISYRDSVVIIPTERIVDIVRQYDTLYLESSAAKSTAFIDTSTHTLKGTLENKQEIQYKYVYRDRVEYRDSIQIKEVPVEVTKIEKERYIPLLVKILSIIGGLSLAVSAGWVISKFV